MCSFTHSVLFYTMCVILHTVVDYSILSQIYALLSVKFSGLKICECKKNDKYQVCLGRAAKLNSQDIAWQSLPWGEETCQYLGEAKTSMGRPTRSGRSNPRHSGGELLPTELSGLSHILSKCWIVLTAFNGAEFTSENLFASIFKSNERFRYS